MTPSPQTARGSTAGPPVDDAPAARGRPRSAESTESILDAAAELLDEIGYEALTMQVVAERAGVQHGDDLPPLGDEVGAVRRRHPPARPPRRPARHRQPPRRPAGGDAVLRPHPGRARPRPALSELPGRRPLRPPRGAGLLRARVQRHAVPAPPDRGPRPSGTTTPTSRPGPTSAPPSCSTGPRCCTSRSSPTPPAPRWPS